VAQTLVFAASRLISTLFVPRDDNESKPMARKSNASSQPLTNDQLREIEALIQKPDSEIGCSDIPDIIAAIHKGLAQAKNGQGRPVDQVFDELENEPLTLNST